MVTKRDFTDKFLKAIKPAPKGRRLILWDGVVPNFGIRISEKSTPECIGSFVLVARYPGKPNPAPRRIGDYPAMNLAKARDQAREWRADLERGIDPKVKEAERRRFEQARRDDTFEAAFLTYADLHLSKIRSGKTVESVVRKHAFPVWKDWPLTDIRRRHASDLVDALAKTTPTNSNRLRAYLKHFGRWAVDKDRLEVSPFEAVRRPTREIKRDRVLSEDEIRSIWHLAGALGVFGRAVQLMLATGQRRTEVGALRWSELDLTKKVWTLPRERAKADREHLVPLSPLALEILADCPKLAGNPYVLSTGRRRNIKKDDKATGRPIGGWSQAKEKLDEKLLEAACKMAEEAGEDKPAALPEWHLHDLRRSAATYMAKLGVDRVVVGKILNHAESSVTAVYDRHSYFEEKKRALELWSHELRRIVAGAEPVSNVVPMRAQ
jgi:integrase